MRTPFHGERPHREIVTSSNALVTSARRRDQKNHALNSNSSVLASSRCT